MSERYKREARERLEAHGVAKLAKAEAAAARPRRQGASKFTTQYSVKWGRSQGWKLVDRENYNFKTKNHHDLMLGSDVIFDDGAGLICVQGAGQSERAEHFWRFNDRGGKEIAIRRHVRFVYIEFVRGSYEPTKTEWWVSAEDFHTAPNDHSASTIFQPSQKVAS